MAFVALSPFCLMAVPAFFPHFLLVLTHLAAILPCSTVPAVELLVIASLNVSVSSESRLKRWVWLKKVGLAPHRFQHRQPTFPPSTARNRIVGAGLAPATWRIAPSLRYSADLEGHFLSGAKFCTLQRRRRQTPTIAPMIRTLISRAKGGADAQDASSPTKAAQAKIKSKAQRSEKASTLLAEDSTLASLSAEQFEMLYHAFVRFGTTRPGFLAVKELGPFLRSLGDFPRTRELLDLAEAIDNSTFLDFPEVCLLVSMRSKHRYDADQVIEAFQRFDSDKTGAVSLSTFRSALQHLAGLVDEELDDICKEAVALSRGEANRRRDLELSRKQAKEEARAAAAARKARKKKEAEEAEKRAAALASDAPPQEGGSFLVLGILPSDASKEDTVAKMFAGEGEGGWPSSPMSPVSPVSPPADVHMPDGFHPTANHLSSSIATEAEEIAAKGRKEQKSRGGRGGGGAGGGASSGAGRRGGGGEEPAEADPQVYYEVVVRTMFSY